MAYRQLIPSQQVDAFRQAVYKTARDADISRLGYIGLIGTSLIEGKPTHDLDVLVFPSQEAGIGAAIVAMNSFFHDLDARLQADQGLYLANCSKKILQPEVNHIISQVRGEKGKLSTHTLFFPDPRSFVAFNPTDFQESIAAHSETVIGDPSVIKRIQDKPQKRLEPYFLLTDYNVQANADRYPQELTLEKTEDILGYLARWYGLKPRKVLPKTPADCVKALNEALLELDEAA